MRRALVLCVALAAFMVFPAHAQESACASIENDTERLACYDAANGRTPRAPAADEERRLLPSLSGLLQGDDANVETPPTRYEVVRAERRVGGQLALIMTNGEVWLLTQAVERLPRAGEQVSIRREAVGLYVLTPATGAPFSVRQN